MPSLLRDFLLSFCPEWVRLHFRPESPQRVLSAATWSGLGQLLVASSFFVIGLKSHLVLRAHQLAPRISGANETGQVLISLIVMLDFLLHPLSLLLLYLAIEGLIRFLGGLVTSEVVPDFFVFLFFKAADWRARSLERRNHPPLADRLNHMPDGRLRIDSNRAKPGWNSNVTIEINGQWFEVECEEHGPSPRPFSYILRPAPLGKVLRGYQEYDAASALIADDNQHSTAHLSSIKK